MTFVVGDLQAVEPEELTKAEGIRIEQDEELDSMGFPRVAVIGRTREAVVEYVRENWGEEDPGWFREYVLDRIEEQKGREVLVHLNVDVPDDDIRSAGEIADALLAALEVGSDDDRVRDLKVVCPMAEEI